MSLISRRFASTIKTAAKFFGSFITIRGRTTATASNNYSGIKTVLTNADISSSATALPVCGRIIIVSIVSIPTAVIATRNHNSIIPNRGGVASNLNV